MQVCDDPTCDAEVYDGHVITKSDAAKVFENDLEAIAPGGHGGASHCDDEHGCLNADASTGLPAQCQKADTIDAKFCGVLYNGSCKMGKQISTQVGQTDWV